MFVIDVVNEEGVQASVVSIDKDKWDGTAWDAKENLLLIKVFENFDKNLSGDATTVRAKGETIDFFAIERTLWTTRMIVAWSMVHCLLQY